MNGRSAQLRMLGVVMAVVAMGACKGRDKLDTAEVKAVTAKEGNQMGAGAVAWPP